MTGFDPRHQQWCQRELNAFFVALLEQKMKILTEPVAKDWLLAFCYPCTDDDKAIPGNVKLAAKLPYTVV